jgi:hypothetical protein
MPATDEDVLRDVLHSSLDDLALFPGCARAIVTRQRRRELRRRFATVGVTGVAAAVAVAVVAESGSAGHPGQSVAAPAHARTVHLSAGQVVLDDLAVKAAAQPDTGRYVTQTDHRAPIEQTTVYDSLTGDLWDYQKGGGAPAVSIVKHGAPTSAELAAKLPTSLAALRSFLISDANADNKKVAVAQAKALAKLPAALRRKKRLPRFTDSRTDSEKVFDQAVDYLFDPLVPAAQRSALFRLLATTPGVQVNAHARDSLGRSAIMVQEVVKGLEGSTTVFESPTTARTLEEDFAGTSFTGKDILQSVTYSNTRPADPYKHR